MNVKEAYAVISSKFSKSRVNKCLEYSSLFVFELGSNDKDSTAKSIGNLYSVNKETGEVKYFIPTELSIEEYKNGKEIKDFKPDNKLSHSNIGGGAMDIEQSKAFISNLIDETDSADELAHYGVLGMKWGVRRAINKSERKSKLEAKALKYEKKAEKKYLKGEKQHAKYDLGLANKYAKKASKNQLKSVKYEKKALNTNSELKKDYYEKKAAKRALVSDQARYKANRLSRMSGYGIRASKTMAKGDKYTAKAAKFRYKLASDKYYIKKLQTKYSSISDSDKKINRELLNKFLELD